MRKTNERKAILKIAKYWQSRGYTVRAAHVEGFQAKLLRKAGDNGRYPDVYATTGKTEMIYEVEDRATYPSKDLQQRKDLRAYASRNPYRHFQIVLVDQAGNIVERLS